MRLNFGTGRQELERRTRRLLAIALVLRQRRMTRAQLAQMFGVCERQIQRDLLLLKAAGCRVRRYGGKCCGYELAWPEPDLEKLQRG
jgi:predicted DNA-binding transcriptional regulator YafY